MAYEQAPDTFAPLAVGQDIDPTEWGMWAQAPWAQPPPSLAPIPEQQFGDDGQGYAPLPSPQPKDNTAIYAIGAVALAAAFFAYMITR